MIKKIALVLLLIFVGLSNWLEHWRIWVSLLLGGAVVGLGFWLNLLDVDSFWPNVVIVGIAFAWGLLWQRWADIQ